MRLPGATYSSQPRMGLMPAFLAALVEVDGAEEVAVVGERDGREVEVLGLLRPASRAAPRRRGGCTRSGRGGGRTRPAGQSRFARPPLLSARLACGFGSSIDGSARLACGLHAIHSHSIVLGGLDEMSKTTRLTPCTSLMIRLEIAASTS